MDGREVMTGISPAHLLVAAAALFVAYLMGAEQGQLLQAIGAEAAANGNLLHEFFHDGRHLIGFPCH